MYLITACMVLNGQSHFHRNKIIQTQTVKGEMLVSFLFHRFLLVSHACGHQAGPTTIASTVIIGP